jgi:pimeloyl-ACP methyl ester carboxylesterase
MHLYCIGTGSPTLVLEAGGGDDVLYWQTVQPKLAEITRVCSYDRAGLGWSDPQAGTRDAEAIVRQLHTLLDEAGVERPVVMAGASVGGYYVREYVREYPAEVVGIAFLDASSPHQVDELPGGRAWYDAERLRRQREVKWDRLKIWSGWNRLVGRCKADVPKVQQNLQAAYDAEECRPAFVGGDVGEFMEFERQGDQAARTTSVADVPVLVLSQDPNRSQAGWTADAIAAQPIWFREQEKLKSLSTHSWRVIARGSSHHVHHDRPELVVQEVGRLIAYVRGGAAPQLGCTTVE